MNEIMPLDRYNSIDYAIYSVHICYMTFCFFRVNTIEYDFLALSDCQYKIDADKR